MAHRGSDAWNIPHHSLVIIHPEKGGHLIPLWEEGKRKGHLIPLWEEGKREGGAPYSPVGGWKEGGAP